MFQAPDFSRSLNTPLSEARERFSLSGEKRIYNRDTLFQKPKTTEPFKFNDSVARVFDDMLHRSVPMYQECQDLTVRWCTQFTKPSTSIYDLGCSTGTLILKLVKNLEASANIKLIGIDNSEAMLKKAKENLNNSPFSCKLIEANINDNLNITNASVVIMNYTLQFIQPESRLSTIKNIYNGLVPGGALVLIEKVKSEVPELSKTFIEFHHQFKEQKGYSKLEISQKREALENVLIPWTAEQNSNLVYAAAVSYTHLTLPTIYSV